MSIMKRAQQWGTFSRIWHIYDAKWQDPYLSTDPIRLYLMGLYKPIYHPMNDCGDHVVVINSKDIALRGDEWKKRMYFHHTTYARGKSYTPAFELHSKDPTMIIRKAVYSSIEGNLQRRHTMQRLHIFPTAEVPKEIMDNVSHQIKQLRPVPIKYDDIPEQEKNEFPKLVNYPENYVLK